jgi:group I intron endonuclease
MVVKVPGIYLIVDEQDSKVYVGSSINLKTRLKDHERKLRSGSHSNYKLQMAFSRKHDLKIIPIPTEENVDVLEQEQMLLDEFIDQDVLLNLARDAVSSQKGIPWTEERTARMREAMTGKRFEPEVIQRLKIIAKDRGMSKEAIEAARVRNTGKKLSQEHIEKVRATSKERMTPEAREHLRQVNLGIPHTPEDIRKMKLIQREITGTPVIINNVEYNSISEAAERLNLEYGCVQGRVNSNTPKFKEWKKK